MEKAMLKFIETVSATGGVVRDSDGLVDGCAGDPEWLDLADAYIAACKAMKVKPTFQESCD